MRRFLPLLAITTLLQGTFSCQNAKEEIPTPNCDTQAVIRNLTGLDGCGYVLVLADGKRLEPHGDTWQHYAKQDGAQVTISYVIEPTASVCMVGQGVRLTCISAYSWCGTR